MPVSRRGVFKAFVMLSIFLAGALSGAAVVRVVSEEPAPAAGEEEAELFGGSEGEGAEGPREGPYEFARYLEEELDLTEQQRVQIQEILERRADEARQIFVESRARFREHLEGTVAEVASALPEEETEEFHRLVEEMERRFGRDEDRDRDRQPTGDPRR